MHLYIYTRFIQEILTQFICESYIEYALNTSHETNDAHNKFVHSLINEFEKNKKKYYLGGDR